VNGRWAPTSLQSMRREALLVTSGPRKSSTTLAALVMSPMSHEFGEVIQILGYGYSNARVQLVLVLGSSAGIQSYSTSTIVAFIGWGLGPGQGLQAQSPRQYRDPLQDVILARTPDQHRPAPLHSLPLSAHRVPLYLNPPLAPNRV